ncbi:CDP-diacylglycerol--glycerol-3-phosphate 3-phosphatidyltransferase [Brevibacterium gallinarum]|uniref:CDP-diacylglycerol--glycerol-3-phosphate 3-phosphatidyltransferase n=1 Tax=Brevibacterium gallinarum TaxID=2762220 RepID=A0ABR8WX80_9MICO|nr:CDP-diacylglycerol--glycerol-3-phosphate 3-phosphatidyltransferase [Brevibacterium gallinarum]MBD8021523.1 CDP-diacylglycerol--glycerol-3-phosphate 3-phosphatidyltransferase [Brevibacterium gallinarum]
MTSHDAAAQKPSNFNVPNVLTTVRILLVPVFLFVLLAHDGLDPVWRLWALIIFLLAMITDKIDGDIARRYNLITDFGKIADPIADKALMSAALLGLWWIGVLPIWIPVIILIREFGITILRLLIVKRIVLPASKGGKLKTVLQTVALALFIAIAPLHAVLPAIVTFWLVIFAWVVLTAAVIVTIVTGVDYLVQIYKRLKVTP